MHAFYTVMIDIDILFVVGMAVSCTLIMCVASVMISSVYANIAIAKAEIAESGKTRRERLNIRADMSFDGVEGDDIEPEETSELDSLARMLGYQDAGSAMSDPSLIAKLGLSKLNDGGVAAGGSVPAVEYGKQG